MGTPRRWLRALSGLLAAALLAAACSDSNGSVATQTAPPPAAEQTTEGSSAASDAPTAAPVSELPNVQMLNLNTGEITSTADLAPNDKPLLLWFWAPH